jgi:streptogramin lyase
MVNLRLRQSLVLVSLIVAAPAVAGEPIPAKPGLPDLQHDYADLKPLAQFLVGETADWVQFTKGAVWVGASGPFAVHQIDRDRNRDIAQVNLPGAACAGLAAGFGSLWVPLCGDKPALARINLKTYRLSVLPIGPAAAEGGIAASLDSLWLVTDSSGSLARIDPQKGTIRQTVTLPAGSFNPIFSDGVIWVSCFAGNTVTAIDARSGRLLGSVTVGPHPRFLTAGAGSIWTLNQGDGTVSRIDSKRRRLTATIALGLPGPGGDIAFADGRVWVTMSGVPLTLIDAATNRPLRQWVGPGGDSLRVDHRTVWLTDYKAGTVSRIVPWNQRGIP